MTDILSIVNYAMVFIFGLVLTAAFSGTLKDKKYRIGFAAFYIFIFIIQAIIFFTFGYKIVEMIYPLVTHLPLILFLVFYCRKSWTTSILSLVCAYLLTSPRLWLGSLVSAMFGGNEIAFYITEILVTIPMLILICRYINPSIRAIIAESGKELWLFSTFLIFYYFFTYAISVYSDMLYSGHPAIIEFIDSTIVMCYFIFNVLYYREAQRRTKAENDKRILEINVNQAQVYIDQMKKSQEQIAVYRHDLHHHLQYINAYLEVGDIADSQKYIKSICDGIAATTIIKYCENVSVNMLLSYYVDKAKSVGISCTVRTIVPNNISVPPVDLCVIIANAMENSIHACSAITGAEKPVITVNAYEKNERLFLEITNPYYGEIKMENEMPVTDNNGHGFGTKSIVMTVEKYNGIWSFKTKAGMFLMHVIL